MSPVFSAVFFAGYFGTEHPIAYISAGLFLIVYHFAAMDFIIKWPFLEITPVKHGFFRRKHQK